MRFFSGLFVLTTIFSSLTSADQVVRADLQQRDSVAACEAVLIALKASAFCSSFVPITDKTVTSTQTGTSVVTQSTSTAPCTRAAQKNKRHPSFATNKPSTTPKTPSTTPKAPSTTPSTTKPSTTATASTCSIKGVPAAVATFACDVIDKACLAFVKPKTSTVTTSVPGGTSTSVVIETPTCPAPCSGPIPGAGSTLACGDNRFCTPQGICTPESSQGDCASLCAAQNNCVQFTFDYNSGSCYTYANCC